MFYFFNTSFITILISKILSFINSKWSLNHLIFSGDGEELDAYLLGVFEPIDEYEGDY